MKWIACLWTVIALAPAGYGQTTALLPNQEALQLYQRVEQLMESTSIVVPGLGRAAAPLLENTRQALTNLKNTHRPESTFVYSVLMNARAYLALADAVPKPNPFPEEGRKQFAELRDAVDRVASNFRAVMDWEQAQLRNPDRDDLRRYAEANQKLGPPSPQKLRVVFLGDSITDGWRLNEYFGERDFVNRGISGQITGQMLGRMQADVINLQPKAVMVLAGTNDIALGVPLGAIENNLRMIADLAACQNIKPLFASLLPVSAKQSQRRPTARIIELNHWLREFCDLHKYTYVDYYSAMVSASGYIKPELSDDGLHPNGSGYRIMAPLAVQAIDNVLKQPPEKKKRRFRIM